MNTNEPSAAASAGKTYYDRRNERNDRDIGAFVGLLFAIRIEVAVCLLLALLFEASVAGGALVFIAEWLN
jgi:hypothetical protein